MSIVETLEEEWNAVKDELADLNPREAIKFVAVGIRDPAKIRTCIESGIDADFAYEMYIDGLL